MLRTIPYAHVKKRGGGFPKCEYCSHKAGWYLDIEGKKICVCINHRKGASNDNGTTETINANS